jgi:hypothetical protein
VKSCDFSQFVMKLITWIYVIDFVVSDVCGCRCFYTLLFNFAVSYSFFQKGEKEGMLIVMLFINGL